MANKTKKWRLILISGGILLAGAVIAVAAVLIAGNLEEGKVIETAYAQGPAETGSDTQVPDTNDTEASTNTSSSDTTDDGVVRDPFTDEPYVAQTIFRAELGPENISEDEAKQIFCTSVEALFGAQVDPDTLSATFDRVGVSVLHDAWSFYNPDFCGGIDAITGEIYSIWELRDYTGVDDFENISEAHQATNEIVDSLYPEYEQLAKDLVESSLANGRQVEFLMVDGIQVVFGDHTGNDPKTLLVDVHVLMDTGRSYTLGFIGSERELYVFMSHPSQEGAMYGFFWEDEASQYPSDWQSGEAGHA